MKRLGRERHGGVPGRLGPAAGAIAIFAGLVPARAAAQSPEEVSLTAARAQDLAEETLGDVVSPLGSLLGRIGSGASYSSDRTGLGSWSVSIGAIGGGLTLTTPDVNAGDPAGADRIEAGVGAAYADGSFGLFRGYPTSGRAQDVFSIEFLARLGYTLGDQTDLGERVDFGSLKPIIGGGLRIGVLRGRGLPAISLSLGVSHFSRRRLSVQGTVEQNGGSFPYSVDLDVRQSTGFAAVEVGHALGAITLYGGGGFARHRMEADYRSGIVFDTTTSAEYVTVNIDDEVDLHRSDALGFAGLELGRSVVRFNLAAGTTGREPYGAFFVRVVG